VTKAAKNLAASIRQRLLNLSREQGRVFEAVLVTYGLERLLYRLSISTHRDNFVLKGGMLVTLWTAHEKRVKRDADFLGHGDTSENHLKTVFAEFLSQALDDGLVFDTERPLNDGKPQSRRKCQLVCLVNLYVTYKNGSNGALMLARSISTTCRSTSLSR
jgi:hypothetical protein